MSEKDRIIISGGGTAGHIFPAVSIAEELNNSEKKYDILFVGAKGRMEMKKIPLKGYKIIGLWIDGIQRSWNLRNLIFPIKLVISLIHSLIILIQYRPKIVIGTGGFASGPIVFVATCFGIPTLIHEQNSFPGLSNRLLSYFVNKICVSYDNMDSYFPSKKIIKTGNPIRKNLKKIIDKDKAAEYFELDSKKVTILIIGGSLGAGPINNAIKKNIERFSKFQIIWQTGNNNYEKCYSLCSKFQNIRVFNFIEKMDFAYTISDVVISRAGAMAITEISFLQKASILIPSPYVSENHQMKNARSLEKHHACIIVKEKELEKNLFSKIEMLLNNKQSRENIAKNAKQISTDNAVKKIIEQVNLLFLRN